MNKIIDIIKGNKIALIHLKEFKKEIENEALCLLDSDYNHSDIIIRAIQEKIASLEYATTDLETAMDIINQYK